MRICANLQLRKIGSKYMIVNAGGKNVNLTEVFTLNDTAAHLWQCMEGKDVSAEELAECLCETYDVEKEQALNDVTKQLAEWKEFGLIE